MHGSPCSQEGILVAQQPQPSSLPLPFPTPLLVPATRNGSSVPRRHLFGESFSEHFELDFSLILSVYHLSPGRRVFLTGSPVAVGDRRAGAVSYPFALQPRAE